MMASRKRSIAFDDDDGEPLMISCTRILAIVVTSPFILVCSRSLAEGSGETNARISLPPRVGLGTYVALREGEPNKLTILEGERIVERGSVQEADRNKPLSGVIEYSRLHGLAIGMQSDKHGDINEKVSALRAFDPLAIRSFGGIGKLDETRLEIIASFAELRELMIEASELLETPHAASQLSGLRKLRYLDIIPGGDQKFGSAAFCRAILSLEKLEYLSMPGEKLTDENVKMLAGHPRLERLFLFSDKPVLGRVSLQALNRMKKLRELGIACTNDITDADVMSFAEIRALEFFSIRTKAPLTCLDRFKTRRPDCRVFLLEPSDE